MAGAGRRGGARRARASSPAGRAQKQVLPSSEELLNLIGSRPVAAEVAEFGMSDIANEFYNPRKYRNLAGEAIGVMGGAGVYEEFPETTPAGEDKFYYIDSRGNYVDTSVFRQSYDIDDDTGELIVPGMRGPQEGESSLPAKLSLVPTSTTDPKRPRTVAAGYDVDRQVLTVVFRDGTWYNYYEVTMAEWKSFKSAVSKGRFIYRVLDYKPRGDASMKGVAAGVRKNLYSISRAAQRGFGGKQKGIK